MPSDWIEDFVDYTASVRSPTMFRLWAGILAVSAILERRTYTVTDGPDPLRPNMYISLVGAPASGKSIAVGLVRKTIGSIGGLGLGPDNPSPASFLDALAATTKIALNGGGSVIQSALTVLCREFGNFIPKYDEGFIANLADIYDNPILFSAPRRTSKSVAIEHPTINILAAATPAALGTLPEAVWGEGLTSRIIFIYATQPTGIRNIFRKGQQINMGDFTKRLEEFYNEVHGEFLWEEEAQNAIHHWFNVEKCAPVPTYGRLVNYIGRRNEHVMKLAMISSVSAGNFPHVTLRDFVRGRQWLLDAEKSMPDVFRSMTAKNDMQLIQDAHYHLYVRYSKIGRDDRKPIPEKEINQYLENKTTSDRIPGIILQMERSGRIKKTGFGDYIPLPFDPHMNVE